MSFEIGDRVHVKRCNQDQGLGTVTKVLASVAWFPYLVELDSRKARGDGTLASCKADELTRTYGVGDRVVIARCDDPCAELNGRVGTVTNVKEPVMRDWDLEVLFDTGAYPVAFASHEVDPYVDPVPEADAEPSEVGFVTEIARAFRDFATRLEGIVKDYE